MNSVENVKIPSCVWFVHVNGCFDSQWTSRALARSQKTKLRSYGVKKIKLSSSDLTIGPAIVDKHS